jgi:two-component system CheB/CheR fusion protein
MNQLFYNLISNALKFRKENVPLVIEVTAAEISKPETEQRMELDPSLSYVDICIKDNGIGFSARYARQIFEIFKRLHPSARFEGTGIGLALCRKIVLNHHGDIYAVSREGVGSAFHILLPLKQNREDRVI